MNLEADKLLREIVQREYPRATGAAFTHNLDMLREAFALGCRMQREADALLAMDVYGDRVQAFGGDEPKAVGAKISVAITVSPLCSDTAPVCGETQRTHDNHEPGHRFQVTLAKPTPQPQAEARCARCNYSVKYADQHFWDGWWHCKSTLAQAVQEAVR